MGALARLQSSSCANPVLDLYTTANGVLTDVAGLEYQIFDKTSGIPVQVYPGTPGDRAPVDVGTLCPAGDKLGVGHYVARWDVPGDANVGTYHITWFIRLTLSDAVQTYTEDFEVLSEAVDSGTYPTQNYCLVSDMREEGVTVAMASDAFLAKRISLASRFIEAATKRFFYARPMTFRVNGTGGPKLLLGDPIIAISAVRFEVSPIDPFDLTHIGLSGLRIYNRHLSQRLFDPDDRNNPKIEMFHPSYGISQSLLPLRFPAGQQNVEIEGVFGYTDPGPDSINTQGKTPDLIRHVCKIITMRELAKISKVSARFDASVRHRLTSERTRDQAYTLAAPTRQVSIFTGDPEIDTILAYFQRPPSMGAV